ncbi:MAG: hypothetical protein WBG50_02980 [Desulfomonilaceae bacterium]
MKILRTICSVFLVTVFLPVASGLSLERGRSLEGRPSEFHASNFGRAEYPNTSPHDMSASPKKRSGTTQIAERLTQHSEAGSKDSTASGRSSVENGKQSQTERIWRSQELGILAIGVGVGDVVGDGTNQIVLIDPNTIYLYRFSPEKLELLAQYSARPLELKSVDVAKLRKQGPARIYVTAQNRGAVDSLVLEYRDRKLTPVVQDFPYYLRVIQYPTQGPILLGQKKGLNRLYDGPVYRLTDKGDDLEVQGRFGVPLKIPVFGFTIGDFIGKHKPLIAVYDRDDHLRLYEPSGKRLFLSKDYYGGSDIIVRTGGPEEHAEREPIIQPERTYFRPRIITLDLGWGSAHQILVTAHSSKTMRLLGRTRMFEEGQVVGLVWNGDAIEEKWTTPKVQGMITDFAIGTLPGLAGKRLITLEREKTDWLAFLRSRSRVRAYDLNSLLNEGKRRKSDEEN